MLGRVEYLLLSMHWAFPLLFCFLHLLVIYLPTAHKTGLEKNQENTRKRTRTTQRKKSITSSFLAAGTCNSFSKAGSAVQDCLVYSIKESVQERG